MERKMWTENLYIFYDFVCPYCRISQVLIKKLVQEYPIVPIYKPFNFAPDIPEKGEPWFLTIAEKDGFFENVMKKSQQWNLKIKIPPLRANSKLALKAAEYAREQNCFERFQQEMFDAYWIEGKNIGNFEVVLDVADSVGLNVNELSEKLNSGAYDQILKESQAAMQKIDYVAIPTFVIKKYRVYGLQEYKVIQEAIQLALNA